MIRMMMMMMMMMTMMMMMIVYKVYKEAAKFREAARLSRSIGVSGVLYSVSIAGSLLFKILMHSKSRGPPVTPIS